MKTYYVVKVGENYFTKVGSWNKDIRQAYRLNTLKSVKSLAYRVKETSMEPVPLQIFKVTGVKVELMVFT